jgi:hypothetical protein
VRVVSAPNARALLSILLRRHTGDSVQGYGHRFNEGSGVFAHL